MQLSSFTAGVAFHIGTFILVSLKVGSCVGIMLTSSPVLLRLYPQFTAMSMGCISVQPSAVQVLERLPGEEEDNQ